MKTNKISKYFRWAIYFIELYLLHATEQSNLLEVPCIFAKPLLVISALVTICLFENEHAGAVFGIISGIFVDISFGTPIGVCAAAIGFTGYLIGVLANYFIRANLWSAWSISCILIVSIISLRFCFLYVVPGFQDLSFIYNQICYSAVYSIVLVPIMFAINRSIYYCTGYQGGVRDQARNSK